MKESHLLQVAEYEVAIGVDHKLSVIMDNIHFNGDAITPWLRSNMLGNWENSLSVPNFSGKILQTFCICLQDNNIPGDQGDEHSAQAHWAKLLKKRWMIH